MYKKLITWWDQTSFYLARQVYYILYGIAAVFVFSYFVPELRLAAYVLLIALALVVLTDAVLLYYRAGISATRLVPDRMSNGDENSITLRFTNRYNYTIQADVIDELPYQFSGVHFLRRLTLKMGAEHDMVYGLTPTQRGEYGFGKINVYVQGPLTMVQRRYRLGENQTVKVYPSYLQLRRYQLLGVASQTAETGNRRLRKLGHSLEFEQIKEYVRGDDYRTINWKATARKGDLMINSFTDERSQQVYCLINKGRVMKMPFEGMTLLDYAINASLVLSGVALQKQDKAGLICFGQQVDAFVPADKKPVQINTILDALYKQETAFLEPDLDKLFSVVRNRITQRSLLILFTNFESFDSLERVLPALKRLAHYHLLLVVFFENTELKQLTEKKASTTEDIYIKTIGEKYRYEKGLIVKELQKAGIIALSSAPQNLTVTALNKYLEVKAKQSL